ncbi:MAG: DNA-directed RNA polymerase subunit beta, partial [Oscillospiraceae bacterium]|nr:DNA-directed RNA polymerase subunit beta [Oscillospiraceae bacterium]
GAWLEYEMDSNDIVYVRIDKNRKIPLTTFLRAIGLGTDESIEEMFGHDERLYQTILEKDTAKTVEDGLVEVYKKLRPGEPPTIESAQAHLDLLFFDPRRYDLCKFGRYKYNKKLGIASRLSGHVASRPIIDEKTGEVLAEAGETLTYEKACAIEQAGIAEAFLTVESKQYYTNEQGQTSIRMVEKEIKVLGNGMVDLAGYVDFDPAEIGIREKVSFRVLNDILDSTEPADLKAVCKKRAEELVPNHITLDDIFASVSYFLNLCEGVGTTDDIDHLGNRRIRRVGELLQNTMRSGMARMERGIRERMNLQTQDMDVITPQALVNIRPVTSQIKEFFCSSPLSQFMDQNNPLAELTHKRRLSALGPGGLSRDRAGFEVRDVHYSHYGRMCPIETPEGPNIGLISYLATFAKINEYGFIEAPYRRVDKKTGIVTEEVVYMPADMEDNFIVAQANEPLTEDGRFARAKVTARYRDKILEIENSKIDYMDVSPKMVVSVATAMIPFLENDDANRALMGANMQRQAVPLLKTERPFVGTGMEYKAAVDSGVCVLSETDGVVTFVSADKIVIQDTNKIEHSYEMIKFQRSNQDTCVNQRPIVNVG